MGKNVIRVALPGYDALTDANPDHFALNSDEDDILIKEFSRGTETVSQANSVTIAHNLGYVPMVLVYYDADGSGTWKMPRNQIISATVGADVTTTNLVLSNNLLSSVVFKYYIFYDQQI